VSATVTEWHCESVTSESVPHQAVGTATEVLNIRRLLKRVPVTVPHKDSEPQACQQLIRVLSHGGALTPGGGGAQAAAVESEVLLTVTVTRTRTVPATVGHGASGLVMSPWPGHRDAARHSAGVAPPLPVRWQSDRVLSTLSLRLKWGFR
jgi:hypothetical protein